MNTRYTLRAVALASVCLAPLAAHAQDSDFDVGTAAPAAAAEAPKYDNEAEVGVRSQSQTSGVFGRYTGQVNSGVFVFGGFKLQARDDWKSGGTQYFSLVGKNLDFGNETATQLSPEASIAFKMGNQGKWGVKASYDAISYAQSTGYSTPFSSKDALPANLHNLPIGGAALTGQALINQVGADSTNLFMGTRRDIGAVSGQYSLDQWTYSAAARHEHKSGFLEASGRDSSTGVTYPQQIDTDTDRYDAGMAYNSKRLQFQLGWSFSDFRNNNPYDDVQALNNVLTSPATGGMVGIAQGPGSTATNLTSNVAYNLTPSTRFNANLAYGAQRQNQAFQSPTSNILPTSVTYFDLATAPGALNALVNTYFANLALTSRPLPRLDTKISYTYDQRDDQTPHFNTCNPVTGACNGTSTGIWGDSGAGTTASLPVGNLPRLNMSWTKQTAKAEAGYRVLDSTKVSAGVTYTDFQRADYTAEDHTKELAEWLKVNSHFSSTVDGSIGYTHAVRAAANLEGGASGPGTSTATLFGGTGPYAMPYYYAGRTQDTIKTRVGYQPIEEAQIGFNGKFTYDKYNLENDNTGMLNDYVLSFGPDIAFEPIKSVTAHVFYNYEQNFHNNQGMTSITTSASTTAGFPISSQLNDITHVAGASVDWKPVDVWKLTAEYNFVEGDTYQSISDMAGGSCLLSTAGTPVASSATCPIPGIQQQMQSLKLTSAYQFAPNLTWFATYGLDYMKDNDYAYQIQGYNTVAGNLSPNDTAPHYFVNSFSTKVQLKW